MPSIYDDLLADPIAFAAEVFSDLDLHDIPGEHPAELWHQRDEAFRLVARAARTPGADLHRYLGEAQDRSNDLALSLFHHGLDVGVTLEQFRQGLLACQAALQRPTRNPDVWSHLERLRGELDELDRRAAGGDDEAA